MPDQKRGIGVKLGGPSDMSRLYSCCRVTVCTSMCRILEPCARATVARKGHSCQTLAGGGGGVSLSNGSPLCISAKGRVCASTSGSRAAGLTNTYPQSSEDFRHPLIR